MTQLLIVADDTQYPSPIRQSALVILKNLIYDEIKEEKRMREEDIAIVKSSILDALIRNTGEKNLVPTFR